MKCCAARRFSSGTGAPCFGQNVSSKSVTSRYPSNFPFPIGFSLRCVYNELSAGFPRLSGRKPFPEVRYDKKRTTHQPALPVRRDIDAFILSRPGYRRAVRTVAALSLADALGRVLRPLLSLEMGVEERKERADPPAMAPGSEHRRDRRRRRVSRRGVSGVFRRVPNASRGAGRHSRSRRESR